MQVTRKADFTGFVIPACELELVTTVSATGFTLRLLELGYDPRRARGNSWPEEKCSRYVRDCIYSGRGRRTLGSFPSQVPGSAWRRRGNDRDVRYSQRLLGRRLPVSGWVYCGSDW